ncbi:N-acetylglucosamine-6-phosphate deacetylase [Cryobacterium levicorallinum]|nr:amidohydrolase family protein [Cryobacterium levicorallinum]
MAPSSAVVDNWIAPALIDVQVNGIAGHNFNGAPVSIESMRAAIDALHGSGVVRFCPTVVTAPAERMLTSIAAVASACESDPAVDYAVLGLHVEGPFISPEDGPRGAHNPAWVRNPDWREFERWQEAARGRISKVTLAPELPGAIDFIERLTEAGIVASIGHSAASPTIITAAIDAGARMATHLGNGSHAMIKRHPNYIWAQLADDRQWAGLIADGFHLPPETLKVMTRAKGHKTIFTSDSSYLALMPAGRYEAHHGTTVVLQENGRLHLESNADTLSGSASTLLDGLRNVINSGILPLGEAIDCVTLHPAELFGLDPSGIGQLLAGGPADLITFFRPEGAAEITITNTVAAGQIVYSA